MKLNKKGFTLVELLAVIVVLAIIALIGYTIVGDVITSAQNGSDARTIESYEKELQTQCLLAKQSGTPVQANVISAAQASFSTNTDDLKKIVPDANITVSPTDCTITISGGTSSTGDSCSKQTNGSWKCGD